MATAATWTSVSVARRSRDGESRPPKQRGARLPFLPSPQKPHPVLLLMRESQTRRPGPRSSHHGHPPNFDCHCGEISRCLFAFDVRELRPAFLRILLASSLLLGDIILPWFCSCHSLFPPFLCCVTTSPFSSQTTPSGLASVRPCRSLPLPPCPRAAPQDHCHYPHHSRPS